MSVVWDSCLPPGNTGAAYHAAVPTAYLWGAAWQLPDSRNRARSNMELGNRKQHPQLSSRRDEKQACGLVVM
jgi:hypothetical protein